MRTTFLLLVAPALAAGCMSFGVETRARSAERVEAAPPPDVFDIPFDRPAGLPPEGVDEVLDQAPEIDEVPHADPERVQDDLEDRLLLDARLDADVRELSVDWRDGTLVLDGIVESQRAHDALEQLARKVAPGTPVRNALVIRID